MRIVAFLLVSALAVCAFGAERTASTTGDWSAKDIWDGGSVPGDGDTIVVKDGVSVNVTDERIVGTSGPKGTLAVNLGKTGSLVICSGGLLRVRGDVVYTPAATQPAVTVHGGGTWRWDASKAAAPKETRYKFYPAADLAFRLFVLAGKTDTHAVLDSDPAGGAGCFTRNEKNYGGPFRSDYGDITRIGDDKTPGWDTWWQGSPDAADLWDVRNTTFTRCGVIKFTNGVGADKTFRHSRNVHVATQGPLVFSAIASNGATAGKGVREINENVFDVSLAETAVVSGFTIRGNYFGNGMRAFGISDPWERCDGNFLRQIQPDMISMAGRKFSDSVVFIDVQMDNPHVVYPPYKYTCNLEGLICSHAGGANVDSGEWLFGAGEFVVSRCILLPNMYGYSTGEMTAITGGFQGHATFDHNTWFGGFGKQWAKYPGFAAFQYSESGNNKPGDLKSFRSNILWNPQLPGKEASFCKLNDVHSMGKDQKDGPPVEDVGDPRNIDYNCGWGYTKDKDIDFENKAHYKNWGKGYIGNWSKTPGEHDVDGEYPQFVDYQRDVQLFATKCLKKTPSRGEWSAKPDKPYAVGDTVLHATTILWGLPVMYRYIGGGENPEPGLGTREKGDAGEWRKSWEWASLYYIREGVRTGQKFGDDDVIMHLIKWIRAGYAPTNPALKGTAHDKGDIGAVPYQPQSARPQTRPSQ